MIKNNSKSSGGGKKGAAGSFPCPYGFAALSERVNWQEPVFHDRFDTERLSGSISYEIEAKTPIFVGDGNGNFYTDAYGRVAVPGSTMRGLVRSNVQILSASSVRDDIQNSRLMYRDITGEKYKVGLGSEQIQVGHKKSVPKKVKAGYICKEGNGYKIYPTVLDNIDKDRGDMNYYYYVLKEGSILNNIDKYSYFKGKKNILQLSSYDKCTNEGKDNRNYKPYYDKVSYKVKGLGFVESVGEPGELEVESVGEPGELENEGYIISSGKMHGKKAVYIIPEIRKENPIIVDREYVDSFLRDYESRKNQLRNFENARGDYFKLPEEGETKPVFYVHHDGELYFGFTPHLRIFFKNDIYAGLPDEQKKSDTDFAKAMFGFSSEDESYKGRVCFMDSILMGDAKKLPVKSYVLAEPKPTSCFDYIRKKGSSEDYATYDDEFRLRGVKQYLFKKTVVEPEPNKNENINTKLEAYDAGASFTGEIKFSNLSDAELGMLLWGLLLENDSEQNIGMGKPYGYGRIKVNFKKLRIQDFDNMYDMSALSLEPYKDMSDKYKTYIFKAKQVMVRFFNSDNIKKVPSISGLLETKRGDDIPDNYKTRYMKLKEYKDRKNQIKNPNKK